MASLVVKTSFFPRHGEVKACCLMTVGNNQSGNGAALTDKSSDYPDWRTYMFLRLTCYSDSVSLNRRQIQGLAACFFDSKEATAGACWSDSGFVPPGESGAFPALNGNTKGITSNDAPLNPTAEQFWSTVTPVDIAGWTQVVILKRGLRVLSDVSLGRPTAGTNGSINAVPGVAHHRAAPLRLSDCGTNRDGINGCQGFPDLNNGSISCPNNNEVTI